MIVNSGGVVDSSGTATTFTNLVLNGGTLRATGGFDSAWGCFDLLGKVTVTSNSVITNVSGANNAITPGAWYGNQTVTMDVTNGATLVNSVPIQNYSAPNFYSVIKSGAGILQFSATNTYTGTTVVNEGTLQVTGSISSSATTVNSNATISGSGTLSALTLNNGSTLSPGNIVGTMRAASSVWNGGSTYSWEITNTVAGIGTNWDLFKVTGALNLSNIASTNKFNLTLLGTNSTGYSTNSSYSWEFVQAGSLLGTGLTNGANVTDRFSLTANGVSGAFKILVGTNGSLATLVISNAPIISALQPTISGTVSNGATLTSALDTTWVTLPALTGPVFQWQISNDGGTTWADVVSATSSSYTVAAGDGSKPHRLKVTGANSDGNFSTTTLASSVPVLAGAPVVSGTVSSGASLYGTAGSWTASPAITSTTFQWQVSTDGITWTNATGTGAATNSYVVAAADATKKHRMKVVVTNSVGSATAYGYPGVSSAVAFTGSATNWTVPPGLTLVMVDLRGASGSAGVNGGGAGGPVGFVTGGLSVTPGEVLQICLGGRGTNQTPGPAAGGFSGGLGGDKGTVGFSAPGGAGGPAAVIFRGTNPVAVAGGGGGGGGYDGNSQTATAGTTGSYTTGTTGQQGILPNGLDQGGNGGGGGGFPRGGAGGNRLSGGDFGGLGGNAGENYSTGLISATSGYTSVAANSNASLTLTYPNITNGVAGFLPELTQTGATTVKFFLTFENPTMGLDVGDFTVTGTATGWSVQSVTGPVNDVFTITLGGASTTEGTVGLTLKSNAVSILSISMPSADTAASAVVTIDRVAPAVTSFTSTTATLTNTTNATFSLLFNENVTGLQTTDFAVSGDTTGWTVSSVTGTNAGPYTVGVTRSTTNWGTMVLTLNSNSVADGALNAGPPASTNASIYIVPTAPTNTVAPTIGGTFAYQSTVTGTNGTWTPTNPALAFSTQWQVSGTNTQAGPWTNIPSATATNYLIPTNYIGRYLRFAVTATNAGGAWTTNSLASAIVTAIVPTAPGAPVGTFGNSNAILSWAAPSDNGGTNLSGYLVQFSTNNGVAWTTATTSPSPLTGTNTNATVTGLTNGVSYVFHVLASNAIGAGPYSSNSAAVVPCTVPSAPTNLAAATLSSGTIRLTFGAPTTNGGSVITSYIATATPGGLTATSSVSPLDFSGLSNGTNYTFSLVASNVITDCP